jgi:hypothetical protein
MAINNPTKLVIDFNADVQTSWPNGQSTVARIITNKFEIPFSSYNVGSVDINSTSTPILLGNIATGVFYSDQLVTYTVDSTDVVNTKFFAYEGPAVPITVSTTHPTAVTVEYALSVSQIPTIIRTAPGAPTITTVTVDDHIATVSFTAPITDGNSSITSYKVTTVTGEYLTTGTQSPITVTGLPNNVAYRFKVSAVNAIGEGAVSALSSNVTPLAPTVPDAPAIYSVVPNNGQVSVFFHPPVYTGRRPIVAYSVVSSNGDWAGGVASPIVVTGLTNGEPLTFTVTAVNVVGYSAPSAPSIQMAAANVPMAPTIDNVDVGAASALVEFTPGDDDGSDITAFIVTATPGNITASGMDSPILVTGLTNGTEYEFTVRAINAVGPSPESVVASNNYIPLDVPHAPTNVAGVSVGVGAVSVSWVPPLITGGQIDSYEIESYNTDTELTSTTLTEDIPTVVDELQSGAVYQFRVRAVNSVGNGAWSLSSANVSTWSVPVAPTAVTAVNAGVGSIEVTFTAPTVTGGSPITSYDAVIWNVDTETSDTQNTLASPVTFGQLELGTEYVVEVFAISDVGTGASSGYSGSVTTWDVPGAPTGVVATAGDEQASVAFTAPTQTGGRPILEYSAISSPGGVLLTSLVSPIIFTELTNGTAYTFEVFAHNIAGDGPNSTPSAPVTPQGAATVPVAPTNAIASLTATALQALVAFDIPNDGGSAILGYTVTSDPDAISATGTTSPIAVDGLTNGTLYDFTVIATNAVGDSLPSTPTNPVSMSAPLVPVAPINIVASLVTPGSISVMFDPQSDNGRPVTMYNVTAANVTDPVQPTYTAHDSLLPVLVAGLTVDDVYEFTVTATNVVGDSLPSLVSNQLPA